MRLNRANRPAGGRGRGWDHTVLGPADIRARTSDSSHGDGSLQRPEEEQVKTQFHNFAARREFKRQLLRCAIQPTAVGCRYMHCPGGNRAHFISREILLEQIHCAAVTAPQNASQGARAKNASPGWKCCRLHGKERKESTRVTLHSAPLTLSLLRQPDSTSLSSTHALQPRVPAALEPLLFAP